MPVWLDIWSELKGGMYLGELDWFEWHFTMKLFKLGRLQYCFKTMNRDIPELDIVKGDKIIDMHIPALGPLCPEDCVESLNTGICVGEKEIRPADWMFAAPDIVAGNERAMVNPKAQMPDLDNEVYIKKET